MRDQSDSNAASTIRKVTKELDYGNANLTLVLPYITAEYRKNEEYFLDYYDDVEICPESANTHFKAAIQIRNRCMIERSDLVICCVEHNSGGAYRSVQFAKRRGVNVINAAELSVN